jgi:hypothetical protein
MRRHRHRHRCHAHVHTSCKGTHKLQRPANIQLPIALLLGQKLQPHSTGLLKHCLHSCSELSPRHQCWAPGPLKAHLQFSCRQWRRAGTHMRQQCVCQPGQHSLWLSAPRACSRGLSKTSLCLLQFVLAAGLANSGSVMVVATALVATSLWGFAVWWLIVAVSCIADTVRHGIPFNLGWWGSGTTSVQGCRIRMAGPRHGLYSCIAATLTPPMLASLSLGWGDEGGGLCKHEQKQECCFRQQLVVLPQVDPNPELN